MGETKWVQMPENAYQSIGYFLDGVLHPPFISGGFAPTPPLYVNIEAFFGQFSLLVSYFSAIYIHFLSLTQNSGSQRSTIGSWVVIGGLFTLL